MGRPQSHLGISVCCFYHNGQGFDMQYSDGNKDFVPSQILGDWIVSPTACSGKHNSSTLLALCDGNPSVIGGFPSQKANNGKAFPYHYTKIHIVKPLIKDAL